MAVARAGSLLISNNDGFSQSFVCAVDVNKTAKKDMAVHSFLLFIIPFFVL